MNTLPSPTVMRLTPNLFPMSDASQPGSHLHGCQQGTDPVRGTQQRHPRICSHDSLAGNSEPGLLKSCLNTPVSHYLSQAREFNKDKYSFRCCSVISVTDYNGSWYAYPQSQWQELGTKILYLKKWYKLKNLSRCFGATYRKDKGSLTCMHCLSDQSSHVALGTSA